MSLGQFGKISIGWGIIAFTGIYAFVLSKNSVDKHRYESMQIRQRMRKSNEGTYEQIGDRRFSG